jgi:DHA2 family multidrug resistance protein
MLGVGFLFVPLNNAAYLYLPKNQINNATGIFNMLRNEGGSLGIAIATTMVDRRGQFHHLRLAEHVRPSRPVVDETLQQFSQIRVFRGGATSVMAHDQGQAMLANLVNQQARVMAYLDVFWLFGILTLLAFPFILLMKKSVARGGLSAH